MREGGVPIGAAIGAAATDAGLEPSGAGAQMPGAGAGAGAGAQALQGSLGASLQALVWQCERVLRLICPCARLRSLLWSAACTSLPYISLLQVPGWQVGHLQQLHRSSTACR